MNQYCNQISKKNRRNRIYICDSNSQEEEESGVHQQEAQF
jgi:hypothetical protein